MDRLRSALSVIGVTLTGSGLLILGFVAYQLWGTSLYTARAQDQLEAEFEEKLAESTTTTTVTSETPPPAPPALPPPPTGEAVAQIRIPRIGLDNHVVEGVSLADLRKAPGHYPSTPLPGVAGNAAIAGHRTTYGAPFNRLDALTTGDEIFVTTLAGSYTYLVEDKKIVNPSQVEVLDPTPVARLTLTTCHPKYSARQRLVVVAGLAENEVAAPAPPPTDPRQSPPADVALADAGLGSERSKIPTVLWGLATAAVGFGWWWAVRRRRHWTTYLAGVPPFLVVLFVFYANLELLLPANF